MNNVSYSKNKIKVLDNADVVVIGGGTAGFPREHSPWEHQGGLQEGG